MIRSRFVDWFVSGFAVSLGFVVFGFSTVLNVSNITPIPINGISDSLGTSVRKEDMVIAVGSISVAFFFLTKVKSSIVILDGIGIVVGVGLVFGFVVCRGVVGGGVVSHGNGGQDKDNKYLFERQFVKLIV